MAPDERQRRNRKRILFFILFAAVCISSIVIAVVFLVNGSNNWAGSGAARSESDQIIRQTTSTLLFGEPEVNATKPSVTHPILGSTLERLQTKKSTLNKSATSVSGVSSMITMNPTFDLKNSSPDVQIMISSSPSFSSSLSYTAVDSTLMSRKLSWITQNLTTSHPPLSKYIDPDSTSALVSKPLLLNYITDVSLTTQSSPPSHLSTFSEKVPTSTPVSPPFQTTSSLTYPFPPVIQNASTPKSVRSSDLSPYSKLYNNSLYKYNQYLQTASYEAQSVFSKSQVTTIPTFSNSPKSLSTFQADDQTLSSQINSSSSTSLKISMQSVLQTANTSKSLFPLSSNFSPYLKLYNTSLYSQYLPTASYEAQSLFSKSQVTDIPTVSNSLTSLSIFQTYVQTLFNSALLSRKSSLTLPILQTSQVNSSSSTSLKYFIQSVSQTAVTSTSLSTLSSNPSAYSEIYSLSSKKLPDGPDQPLQTASTEARSSFPTSQSSNLTAMTNNIFQHMFTSPAISPLSSTTYSTDVQTFASVSESPMPKITSLPSSTDQKVTSYPTSPSTLPSTSVLYSTIMQSSAEPTTQSAYTSELANFIFLCFQNVHDFMILDFIFF